MGKSSTACPSTQDWTEAFGDAENVFCVTLTSALSGSYNSARVAGEEYMETHPGRKVHVVDTLSAGPELRLVVEKLRELAAADLDAAMLMGLEMTAEHLQRQGAIMGIHSLEAIAFLKERKDRTNNT